jgi:hypothetical protein
MKCWGALLCFILSSLLRAQSDSLILSEIMFYPVSGNNEFIELYNCSPNSINLAGYRIKYYTSTPDTIIDAGNGTILNPGSYAVIMEGDYDFESGIYQDIIPASAIQLKITSNAFGSNGMANTTSRPLWLISPKGDTLDCYFYSADNSASVSDEKIVLFKDSSSFFWKNSIVANGTPGYRNSVLQNANDLSLKKFLLFPSTLYAGDELELYAVTRNNGLLPASVFMVNLYEDNNFDSVPAPSELLYSAEYQNLLPGDTVTSVTSISRVTKGLHNFIAEIIYKDDEYLQNNYSFASIEVPDPAEFNSVIISEIMYAPQNMEPEWVEIFNNSEEAVNLKEMEIG